MANIKSQVKRIDIGERNNALNSARKSEARTAMKKVEAAVAAKDKATAEKELPVALSLLDQLAQDGIISKNSVLRKKSHLQKEVAAL
ncbi:MAG: 30S ribosomal protein S20 [Erysipelotrichaceae bacterium]|nr:30S ribosomal protein S20 [Erysipelotrichaceae bacterium]